jgi:hypothetical protein
MASAAARLLRAYATQVEALRGPYSALLNPKLRPGGG